MVEDIPFKGEKTHYLVYSLKRSYTYWICSPLGLFLHSGHRNHLTVDIPANLKLSCPQPLGIHLDSKSYPDANTHISVAFCAWMV